MGESQKFLRKHFTMRVLHAKHVGIMGCRDEKTNFFQLHSGNNVKFATPAAFEYQIPNQT